MGRVQDTQNNSDCLIIEVAVTKSITLASEESKPSVFALLDTEGHGTTVTLAITLDTFLSLGIKMDSKVRKRQKISGDLNSSTLSWTQCTQETYQTYLSVM